MRSLTTLAVLALVIALPFALRPEAPASTAGGVVVITPHGEAIREEFGKAFAAWSAQHLGRAVAVDWRSPGGTADIIRFLEAGYKAGGPGIDVIFGGGEFAFRRMDKMGFLEDAGLLRDEPAWFGDAAPIPFQLSGETITDRGGRYYGACLSTFGICWHLPDALRLGVAPPDDWAWLGDPRLVGLTTFADPARSGAAATAMERVIQSRIARAMGGEAAARSRDATPQELERGWADGLAVLRRIAANARQVTDGASKAVRDTARGDAFAAMCIDFHARAEADHALRASGSERLGYADPPGGTSVSADPIALLKAAPHREEAVAFIRFVMSVDGQRLWNRRPGVAGGPQTYALRRMPVRRDLYTADERALMSDPQLDPYALAATVTYRPAWTQSRYNVIAAVVKATMVEPREELQAAWIELNRGGGDAALFDQAPVTWAEAGEIAAAKLPRADELARNRRWQVEAAQRYRLVMGTSP